MSTPLLLEVAHEIDTNPTSFYRVRGRGESAPGPRWGLRLQTPVIGSRSALAMSVHPTYFDLAMPRLDSYFDNLNSSSPINLWPDLQNILPLIIRLG